jgi:hypothetical protein
MCWKQKPPPVVVGNKVALLFGINNYPGGSDNDLNGCINDINDVAAKLNSLYPSAWTIELFKDSEVTKFAFRNSIKNQIVAMKSGDLLLIAYSGHGTQVNDPHHDEDDGYDEALYLYDGVFTDDEFNSILQLIPDGAKVIIGLDSCFSGTATRLYDKGYLKAKYIPGKIRKSLKRRKKYLKSDIMKWVVFSGCQEDQTSADAYIAGRYNGAFTWAWLKTIDKSISYNTWCQATINKLDPEFDQVPTIEGDCNLRKMTIFT